MHANQDASGPSESEAPTTSADDLRKNRKKARKRLADAADMLDREIGKYRAALKKARHDSGYHSTLEDREKVKKAEWMQTSLHHYVKSTAKKSATPTEPQPDEHFYLSVAASIADLKAARKRIKAIRKE
ncbi:MAG TPA: hypothetical protein VGK19_17520 [Capsulimonadaceae bacterium]|jgi:DNA-binding transcriptional MocR family regulator